MALNKINMSKKYVTKIGDIFFVESETGNKTYFQYIANDLTQLNSDVIRVFKKEYSFRDNVDYSDLLSGEIDFHAHTMINVGVKINLFHKVGNYGVFPDVLNIIFRNTNDYGHANGEKPIRTSNNWYIWRIGDKTFTPVGKLNAEYSKAEIGIVIPPYAIVERIKTGKFNFIYPDYE